MKKKNNQRFSKKIQHRIQVSYFKKKKKVAVITDIHTVMLLKWTRKIATDQNMFEIKLILKWIHVCVVGVFIHFYGDGKCMQIHFSGGKIKQFLRVFKRCIHKSSAKYFKGGQTHLKGRLTKAMVSFCVSASLSRWKALRLPAFLA